MLNNLTCDCVAHTYFDNYTGKCIGICGDTSGFGNDCDLGPGLNLNGSGCFNCTVETDWYCSTPNINSNSVCVGTTVY